MSRAVKRRASSTPGAEAAALKAEIIGKLSGLLDTAAGSTVAIREAFDTATLYAGPYVENAPDLLIGYNAGYRISWDGATGVVAGPVFEDNTKAWSGDHCIDPAAGARRVLLQPLDERPPIPRSSTSRQPRSSCSASSRRPTWMAARWPASYDAAPVGSGGPHRRRHLVVRGVGMRRDTIGRSAGAS